MQILYRPMPRKWIATKYELFTKGCCSWSKVNKTSSSWCTCYPRYAPMLWLLSQDIYILHIGQKSILRTLIYSLACMLYTMYMTDKERGQNIQFLILPSTIDVVDKGTSLHCYYVKICWTGVTCIFTRSVLVRTNYYYFFWLGEGGRAPCCPPPPWIRPWLNLYLHIGVKVFLIQVKARLAAFVPLAIIGQKVRILGRRANKGRK